MHPSIRRYLALLATYLQPQWRRTSLMAVLLFTSIGLQLVNPQILRYFIDTAVAGGTSTALLLAGILFISVAILNFGVSIATTYLSEYVAWTATNSLRADLVAHCLSLDMAFHKTHTSGEMIERIDGDVDALSNFFSQFIVHLLGNALLTLGILALLFSIDWRVGLTISTLASLALIILIRMNHHAAPFWVGLRRVSAEFSSFLGEHLIATEDMRGNGATAFILRRFHLLLRRWLPINRKATFSGYNVGAIFLFMFIIVGATALSLGAYLWSVGSVSIGTVYLMFAYSRQLDDPVEQIQTQLQDLQQASACIQRIEELLQTESALDMGQGKSLPEGALSVAFRDVSFGYSAENPVLHHLTFDLAAGNILGVIGRTGSGKTTLARLLFRLYDPQTGDIRLSGIPIQLASLREVRQRIGMVTQDVQLFHATVRDNLTFFNHSIPDSQIMQALEDMRLSGWYQTLPRGLDSELGSGGEGISAGEAQLLAFTRVFLMNPGLIILDEALSRLDPATEQLIEQAMTKLFSGRTGIIIAHRLTTLEQVDEIIMIEGGRILEHGRREEIANDPTSHFAYLLQVGLEEISA